MPTYTWKCPARESAGPRTSPDGDHSVVHVQAPVARRDEAELQCAVCGERLERVVDAPQRTPGTWYRGNR